MSFGDKIYLDYNATAPAKADVIAIVADILTQGFNASSVHNFGRKAKAIIESSRAIIAKKLDAQGANIIFTSSATEANNLAINGFKSGGCIVSSIEHHSVLLPAKKRAADLIPADKNGVVNLKALEKILKNTKGRALVSVMLANNETGVIQPIKEIAQIVYANKGFLHCDAVQALGKIDVSFNDLNVDMMTISAHKIGGTQGAGALIVKKGLDIKAQIIGGGQESGFRAGTQNIAAIAGFAKAVELIVAQPSDLRDYLEAEIKSFANETIIFGENSHRLPNTSLIALQGMSGQAQVINFDLAGIAVSSGSSCSSGKIENSHVLLAMGTGKTTSSEAIRISIGAGTTKDDVDSFISVWKNNWENVNKKVA